MSSDGGLIGPEIKELSRNLNKGRGDWGFLQENAFPFIS